MRPNNHFIFDANLLMFRAAHQAMAAAKSETLIWDETCVSKVLSDIQSVLMKFQPEHAYIVWDGGRSKRRKAIYPEYKKTASRESRTPEDFAGMKEAVGKVTKILRKLGCRVITMPGREADDVIAHMVSELGGGTVVSDDRDFFQLVAKGARIYRPGEDKVISAQFFFEETGLKPEQYLLAKALIGDNSDNLPGVYGIGEETAKKLLSTFGVSTVDDLMKSVETIEKPKKREQSLKESWDVVKRNVEMMDFFREVFTANESSIIRQAMARETSLDETVLNDIKEAKLSRIAMNFNGWCVPFRRLM